MIQGRFQHAIPFTHLYSGQLYTEALQQRPTSWLFSSLSKLQPGHQSIMHGNMPYFLAPLFAMAQQICKYTFMSIITYYLIVLLYCCKVIHEPGKEPDILSCYQLEHDELALLSPKVPFSVLNNPRKRRMYFAQR